MFITVIDVGSPNSHPTSKGGSYQSIEVTYKGEDSKVGSKKLMSFANPTVFNAAKTWAKGDTVNIRTEKLPGKDGQLYWQWTGIDTGDAPVGAPSQTTGATPTSSRPAVSNYETREERAARQILIVRQSTLSNAIALLTTGAKAPPSNADVFKLADELQTYIFNEKPAVDKIADDMEDDIPY
jgi:hypothetical protein